MPFQEGEILLIKDFEFPKRGAVLKKDKYLIPLLDLEGNMLLISLPSSQQYLSNDKKQAGCIDDPEAGLSIYHFPAGQVISDNDFSFPKDTFLYLAQVFETTEEKLLDYNAKGRLTRKGILTQQELVEVLYCAYKSTQIPEKYKPMLESRLENLA